SILLVQRSTPARRGKGIAASSSELMIQAEAGRNVCGKSRPALLAPASSQSLTIVRQRVSQSPKHGSSALLETSWLSNHALPVRLAVWLPDRRRVITAEHTKDTKGRGSRIEN